MRICLVNKGRDLLNYNIFCPKYSFNSLGYIFKTRLALFFEIPISQRLLFVRHQTNVGVAIPFFVRFLFKRSNTNSQ